VDESGLSRWLRFGKNVFNMEVIPFGCHCISASARFYASAFENTRPAFGKRYALYLYLTGRGEAGRRERAGRGRTSQMLRRNATPAPKFDTGRRMA
jgi:hypothetical protein